MENRKAPKTQVLEERAKELEKSQAALMNILEDVKEAQESAEEERNKTLAVINNFSDGILFFDKNQRIILANPQAEFILGIKSSDLMEKLIGELKAFPSLSSLVDLVGAEIKNLSRKEIELKKDLVLEVSTVRVKNKEEEIGSLIILHDVTREKRIEMMKTEFVSLVAHQLRTPLSAIKWTLKMLLDGDLGQISNEQKEFVEKTYRSNERMIGLINDLLDATRIEEGRYLFKPQLASFEDLVKSVVEAYKDNFSNKKIDIKFTVLDKKLPGVMMDAEKLRLAVQNLIDNALRYTLSPGKVEIFLRRKEGGIEFQIKDSGVGIPQDQQERIFTKFFRAANVLRLDTEGSGLGLFIAQNIVEAHNGKIWFESKEGQGASFYFTLPVGEEFGDFLKKF